MRIEELFENTNFDDSKFINEKDGSIDYDLAEDLVFFMNNDDDVYRRSVYPAIVKYSSALEKRKPVNPSVFKQAALESYRSYTEKYPIRTLPSELDEELCNEVCELMFKEISEAGKDKE